MLPSLFRQVKTSLNTESDLQEIGRSAVWKASWILLPTVLVTGMIAYIDRTNLAYAATSVKKTLHINNSQYGLASGILYLSYCFFQVGHLTKELNRPVSSPALGRKQPRNIALSPETVATDSRRCRCHRNW